MQHTHFHLRVETTRKAIPSFIIKLVAKNHNFVKLNQDILKYVMYNLAHRVIKKTLDSTLEIYFWEGVYQVKQIFMVLERGAN